VKARLLIVVALALPFAAWAFVKPVRVLAPQLEGLTCERGVCVDDPARRARATALYDDALRAVEKSVATLQTRPRAVFCSTEACARSFGITEHNAYTVGTFAIVVGDRGWWPFFVRHELIHHLQNERLGGLRMWLFKPLWFREGMAYSLSGDPRHPLPEPLQGYRSSFDAWYASIGRARLWTEASRL